MRYLRPLFACFLILVMLAPAAEAARRKAPARVGESDPRYAALIMNPTTGEVYHSRAADERRVPASLTKMMTLYLLFEALEKKEVSLDTKLKVSDYATTMPQTNLSLSTFDRMPVDTAIKALVVRSANDVAVVVAENLSGSVESFAKEMTSKARALGMNGTVFKNPNGLPNEGQYTTARDMAKLGIALKRDFPQYYDYFSVRQFSWNGITYYTHNRVMLRYAGTDGIKTGYTYKAGFNLVTSCTRGGRPLLGVVLGGTSGGWRDKQMISLMDKGYQVIASRGQQKGRMFATNLPNLVPGTKAYAKAEAAAVAEAAKQAPVAKKENGQGKMAETVAKADRAVAAAAAVPTAPAQTLDAQVAALAEIPPVGEGDTTEDWGIQVGAYSTKLQAEDAAKLALDTAGSAVQGSHMSIVGAGAGGNSVHRARLKNLSQDQAKKACEVLISHNSPCFIFRADSENL